MEADERLVQGLVFQRTFSDVTTSNDFRHVVYPLWSAYGIVPPSYMGKTFAGTHSHYLVSGGATTDSGDVEMAMAHVVEHGYRSQLLLLVNPAEAEEVQSWRAGEENANSQEAKFDFIPSSNAPTYLTQDSIVGALPPPDVDGVPCLGSYGKAGVLESNVIPQGYFAVVASGGANNESNPFAQRVHPKTQYQGLRAIPGHWQGYPLIEGFLRTRYRFWHKASRCSGCCPGEGVRYVRRPDYQPIGDQHA